jgi:hypothetical protein
VRTELRRGIRAPKERARVLASLDGCAELAQPDDVWNEAGELGAFVGRKSANVTTLDLLIAAWGLAHRAAILTRDADFATMRRAGVPIVLGVHAPRVVPSIGSAERAAWTGARRYVSAETAGALAASGRRRRRSAGLRSAACSPFHRPSLPSARCPRRA